MTTKETLERIADALEGIELALLIGAGVVEPPGSTDDSPQLLKCICGVTMQIEGTGDLPECPNCHEVYHHDGNVWIRG